MILHIGFGYSLTNFLKLDKNPYKNQAQKWAWPDKAHKKGARNSGSFKKVLVSWNIYHFLLRRNSGARSMIKEGKKAPVLHPPLLPDEVVVVSVSSGLLEPYS